VERAFTETVIGRDLDQARRMQGMERKEDTAITRVPKGINELGVTCESTYTVRRRDHMYTAEGALQIEVTAEMRVPKGINQEADHAPERLHLQGRAEDPGVCIEGEPPHVERRAEEEPSSRWRRS